VRCTMTRHLLFYMLLAAISVASVRGTEPSSEKLPHLVRVGLVADDPAAPAAVPEEAKSCEGVTLTRNLKYGDSEQNVLDIATGSAANDLAISRPVLLFVAGESFSAENAAPDVHAPMPDTAMCFAARHGMVGVRMSYRLAPPPIPGRRAQGISLLQHRGCTRTSTYSAATATRS
jgi:hypothetical protein